MAAIVGPADALMRAAGKLVGNFKVQMRYKEDENDVNALNALGLVINNIVASCTFRPQDGFRTSCGVPLDYTEK